VAGYTQLLGCTSKSSRLLILIFVNIFSIFKNILIIFIFLPPPPRWYHHLDEGVSRVGVLESLNDARGYADGRLASGRATLARQALVERTD